MNQTAKYIGVDYVTIENGKIITLPVREYVQPDKSIEEQMMDMVGRSMLYLVPSLLIVMLAYHYNWWIIPAMLSAGGLGLMCRQRGWW